MPVSPLNHTNFHTHHQSIRALEIVHSDLWGPSPVISHAGNRYYVIFIDDFTRYTRLYPLKLKSDVLSVFLDFQLRVESQFGQKIINFQSDWGGEFQALHKHLTRQGIAHRVSCPHTPAQNGTAERKHQHIIETALSLMRHSSVPHRFWDEAVCTAVYLINRLPTPTLRNRSPYHLVFNQGPTYSVLRNFGCTCYPCFAHMQPQNWIHDPISVYSLATVRLIWAIAVSLCQVANYTSVGTSSSENTTIHLHRHHPSKTLHPLRLSDFLDRLPHPLLQPIWISLHSPPLTQPFNHPSHRSSRHHLHHRRYLHHRQYLHHQSFPHYLRHRYRLTPRSHRYYPLLLLIHPTQIPPSIPPVI